MSMSEWAAEEVRIACQKENPDRKEGEFDYGCSCYESALKAYKSMCEDFKEGLKKLKLDDGHSGFSFSLTKQLFDRLCDGKPLTLIEDVPEVWGEPFDNSYGVTSYQCKRMGSLFKNVSDDGQITYSDNNRIVCYDINNPKYAYGSGLIKNYFDTHYPITLPYYPGKPIKAYSEDFLFDEKNGDFDTIGIIKAVFPPYSPDGKHVVEEHTPKINAYFAAGEKGEDPWRQISRKEYLARKEHSKNAKKNKVQNATSK